MSEWMTVMAVMTNTWSSVSRSGPTLKTNPIIFTFKVCGWSSWTAAVSWEGGEWWSSAPGYIQISKFDFVSELVWIRQRSRAISPLCLALFYSSSQWRCRIAPSVFHLHLHSSSLHASIFLCSCFPPHLSAVTGNCLFLPILWGRLGFHSSPLQITA